MADRSDVQRLERTATLLSGRSVARYTNPHARFDWPERAPRHRLAMSEALLSLTGHPILATLDDETRWRLSLLEAAHFFSLNIAGERELMVGLAMRLHGSTVVVEYLHHFLHEENAHSVVFSRFCTLYGRIYPSTRLQWHCDSLPGEEDILFFGRVLVFEQIADHYNRALAMDDALWPLARAINRYHAEDEARHIAFGRRMMESLWERFALSWPEEARRRVVAYLREYIAVTLRSYASAAVYSDAGLPEPHALRRQALAAPERADLASVASRRTLDWLEVLEATAA